MRTPWSSKRHRSGRGGGSADEGPAHALPSVRCSRTAHASEERRDRPNSVDARPSRYFGRFIRPNSVDARPSRYFGRYIRPNSVDARPSRYFGRYIRPNSGDACASALFGRYICSNSGSTDTRARRAAPASSLQSAKPGPAEGAAQAQRHHSPSSAPPPREERARRPRPAAGPGRRSGRPDRGQRPSLKHSDPDRREGSRPSPSPTPTPQIKKPATPPPPAHRSTPRAARPGARRGGVG